MLSADAYPTSLFATGTGRLHILAYVLRHEGKDEQGEALLRQALAILYLLLTAWLLRNLIETRQS